MVSEFKLKENLKILKSLKDIRKDNYLFIFYDDKILCQNNNPNSNFT